jgi:arsenate reductase (glutaredoxin)
VGALTIWHNPKCNKSRETLALLQDRGFTPHIVEYLKDPPNADELAAVVAMLGIAPEALVRKGEGVYKSKYAGRSLTGAAWIQAMVADPILIERPIVVADGRAAIGRPPERVLAILEA